MTHQASSGGARRRGRAVRLSAERARIEPPTPSLRWSAITREPTRNTSKSRPRTTARQSTRRWRLTRDPGAGRARALGPARDVTKKECGDSTGSASQEAPIANRRVASSTIVSAPARGGERGSTVTATRPTGTPRLSSKRWSETVRRTVESLEGARYPRSGTRAGSGCREAPRGARPRERRLPPRQAAAEERRSDERGAAAPRACRTARRSGPRREEAVRNWRAGPGDQPRDHERGGDRRNVSGPHGEAHAGCDRDGRPRSRSVAASLPRARRRRRARPCRSP